MPDEEQEEPTVSEIDTVIVVPTTDEPLAPPDYGATIAALEMRVAALEAARVEAIEEDTHDDRNDDAGDDDAGAGEGEAEAGSTEEGEAERDKPITRHWLFGKLW